MKKRLWVTMVVVAAIVALGVFVYVKNRQGDLGKTVTLPNGATITLVSVSYGTNHTAGGIKERIGRYLPAKIRHSLGILPAETFSNGVPALGVCLWIGGTGEASPS